MLFPLHPPKAEFQKVTHSRVNQGFGLIDHLANPGLLEHLAGGMGCQKKKYFLFFFCQKQTFFLKQKFFFLVKLIGKHKFFTCE